MEASQKQTLNRDKDTVSELHDTRVCPEKKHLQDSEKKAPLAQRRLDK